MDTDIAVHECGLTVWSVSHTQTSVTKADLVGIILHLYPSVGALGVFSVWGVEKSPGVLHEGTWGVAGVLKAAILVGGRGVARSAGVLMLLEGVRILHGVEGMPPAGAILDVSPSSVPDTLSNSCAHQGKGWSWGGGHKCDEN